MAIGHVAVEASIFGDDVFGILVEDATAICWCNISGGKSILVGYYENVEEHMALYRWVERVGHQHRPCWAKPSCRMMPGHTGGSGKNDLTSHRQ